MTLRCRQPELAAALQEVAATALVFVADPTVGEEWEAVLAELTEAFQLTQEAVRAGQPVVYVVENDSLLGRTGAGPAMVATGLLSGARTAALEQSPVNVVAVGEGVPADLLAEWCRRAGQPGMSGELLHLGGGHLGKTLP
jgi:hypothetical protein